MIGENSLLVLGDRSNLHQARISVTGDATVMIGEGTTATLSAQLDARNGGAILVGADGMWANDLRIITDDMHAIRDKKTGERINTFGGRVLVERHVWFGERVMVVGDCRIGEDTVIGSGAIVKSGALPPNSICVGQPARAIRTGTTWTRDDLP
jgi:acetyltransferase-like isoleucine patch superfamily enzyme